MRSPARFGTALSAVAVASIIAGCASPTQRIARSASNQPQGEVGLATRAQLAMASGDYATALPLAERAVERTPGDANVRTLLGNAYFASGRFASAEAAYRDSLTLNSRQPQVVLKHALVQIALGKNSDALAFLDAASSSLPASDYGLALALAGRVPEAVAVLDTAARQPGADAQVRQNLALAHALAGNWQSARVVAAQDLPADVLDARMTQWMGLASPARASDQVAALIGVTPVAVDPGQPVRLALNSGNTRMAAAAPVQQPAPQVAQAQVVPSLPPLEPIAPAGPQVEVAELAPRQAALVSAPVEQAQAAPAFEQAFAPVLPPPPPPARKVRSAPSTKAAKAALQAPLLRRASLPRASGNSGAVVQLGAYASPQRVASAWNTIARRYSALRDYAPVSAKFSGPKGTVYRLSVKGFASAREAQGLCSALRRSGGNCFVRSVAGDSPVRIASR